MNYQNLFKIAIRAIAANKMRSFLTALGIIIGIAAVITMLAIGQGSKASIKANIAEMGSNMIMISPGADMRGGVIGVLLGVSLSVGLQQFLHVATQIEPWSIIMSFAVCTFTGVFFGWYPAKKAARLDPIEAIRYE